MKHIGLIALRWLLGGVFIFSGLVKCVDPVGASVFVDKYLATYSLEALLPYSLSFAIVLAVVEVAIGILLVIGVLRRYVSLAATIFFITSSLNGKTDLNVSPSLYVYTSYNETF